MVSFSRNFRKFLTFKLWLEKKINLVLGGINRDISEENIFVSALRVSIAKGFFKRQFDAIKTNIQTIIRLNSRFSFFSRISHHQFTDVERNTNKSVFELSKSFKNSFGNFYSFHFLVYFSSQSRHFILNHIFARKKLCTDKKFMRNEKVFS